LTPGQLTLYRIVRSNPPNLLDFTSDEALGKKPRRPQREDPRLYRGISTWDSVETAANRAREYHLGEFIAQLAISTEDAVVIAQTRGSGHYSVEAAPEVLLDLVQAVFRVESGIER
jgi:hypothetical protein